MNHKFLRFLQVAEFLQMMGQVLGHLNCILQYIVYSLVLVKYRPLRLRLYLPWSVRLENGLPLQMSWNGTGLDFCCADRVWLSADIWWLGCSTAAGICSFTYHRWSLNRHCCPVTSTSAESRESLDYLAQGHFNRAKKYMNPKTLNLSAFFTI